MIGAADRSFSSCVSGLVRLLWSASLAAMSVAAPHAVTAQSALGSEREDFDRLRGDVWAVWTAPARFDRRALVPVASAVAAVALTATRDSAIYVWLTTHPNATLIRLIGPLREKARFPLYELGSGQGLLPVSGLIYIAGRLSHKPALRNAGLGCAASHISSVGIRMVTYLGVSRVRPRYSASARDIGMPGQSGWNDNSFPGGHVANAMACASFVSHRYSARIAEPLMYGTASVIGLGRMADGAHWASDTMVGATLGFAIGKLVADRQLRRATHDDRGASVPSRDYRIVWSFAF
jgi:membrane-associated phospholipid phosphatase